MLVVDSNILLYAVNRAAPEAAVCRSLLEEWSNGFEPWFLGWGSIYEFMRVVTHPRMPNPLMPRDALAFLGDFFASPSLNILEPTDQHLAVLREVLEEVPGLSGNAMFDLRTAVLMREHGIRRIVTRDRDFARFPFVEVVDPLA